MELVLELFTAVIARVSTEWPHSRRFTRVFVAPPIRAHNPIGQFDVAIPLEQLTH